MSATPRRLTIAIEADDLVCGEGCPYLDADHENWTGATCTLFDLDLCEDIADEGVPRAAACIAREEPTP